MSPATCEDVYLDCLDGILYLKDATLWGESIDAAIVIAPE